MSLETIAAGMFALKGLSLVTRALRGDEADTTMTREVSETDFNTLVEELLGKEEGVGDQEKLSELLFEALDADGSGALQGREVAAMERLVSRVQRGAAGGEAASA